MNKYRLTFLLGFVAAVVAIVAIAVVAGASTGRSDSHKGAAAAGPVPAAAQMAVFSRTRSSADAVPAADVAKEAALGVDDINVPGDQRPGTPNNNRSHLLLDHVGISDAAVYAVPTDKGRVCFIFTAGAEGCVAAFTDQVPTAYVLLPPDIVGLVPDSVTRVTVRVNGSEQDATLRNGAFFYELQPNAAAQAITLYYDDGHSRSVDVAG